MGDVTASGNAVVRFATGATLEANRLLLTQNMSRNNSLYAKGQVVIYSPDKREIIGEEKLQLVVVKATKVKIIERKDKKPTKSQ
jgi:lipopolysaccharide assembly outer membrane protein LptD (OstA)